MHQENSFLHELDRVEKQVMSKQKKNHNNLSLELHSRFNISWMCKTAGVSISGYYVWIKRHDEKKGICLSL
jgi:hypothetical protein